MQASATDTMDSARIAIDQLEQRVHTPVTRNHRSREFLAQLRVLRRGQDTLQVGELGRLYQVMIEPDR